MTKEQTKQEKGEISAVLEDNKKPQKKKEKKTTKRPTLKKQLQEVKKELETVKDQYLRALAEFDNYKKRRNRDFLDIKESATIYLIEELLPIIDDLERSLNSSYKKKTSKSFYEGVELIYNKFRSIFEKHGVVSIDAVGKSFDPELHDALMHLKVKDQSPNIIVEEVLTGYKIKDKVIRYSKVVVSK